FASALPGLSQNNPTEIMKEMLKRRHLSPIYGGVTPLAPEKEDYLVIDIVPDIFVTGHVHVSCIESYRGVILLNASAWQKQTEYQKTMNLMPQPAKPIVINLANFKGSVISF
ncbi:MAG: DNA polymerase II small subunit, partial [Candidatus Thermoplasmatota archaeon]